MSSLTLGTRASGQAVGRRAPAEGPVAARDAASRAIAAATGPVTDRSRREGVVETGRLLAGMIGLYAFLVVLPLLALVPVLPTGLFFGVLTTLFSGIV